MNSPVRCALQKVLYLFLSVVLFQLTTVIPVSAVGEPALAVDVTIPSGPFQMGDEFLINIEVSNTADNLISVVQLQLPYHANLLYVGGQGLPATGATQATLNLGDLAPRTTTQVTVTARIRGIPSHNGPIRLPFQALGSESTSKVEEAQLIILRPLPEQANIPTGPVHIQRANGRVALDFPNGWHPRAATLDFELLQLRQLTADESGTLLAFEVEATENGVEIESFNAPITVTLAISDLVDLEAVPLDELNLKTREDETEPWVGVPFTVTQGILQF